MLTQEQAHTVEENIRQTCDEYARNAVEWWFDATMTRENAERILQGIEDCDPEVMDSLPMLDWSGQWADGLNWENELSNAMPDRFDVPWSGDEDYDAFSDEMFMEHSDGDIVAKVEAKLHEYLEA